MSWMKSEAHLDAHGKFCAREVTWYEPRPNRLRTFVTVYALAGSIIFVTSFLAIAGMRMLEMLRYGQ